MSTVLQAVEGILEELVTVEAEKVLPLLAKALPNPVGALASSVLANPEVQARLEGWEKAGLAYAFGKGEALLTEAQAWLQAHLPASIAALEAKAAAALSAVHVPLTLEQAQALGKLAAAGKLQDVLNQALKDLGLS